VVRGALARGWRRGERSGHSCALGEGARFLSDCARATHRRVRKLTHPLEGRRRVAHRGRATGQPLSPVDSDARRALRRAQVRDRDGRRGKETSKFFCLWAGEKFVSIKRSRYFTRVRRKDCQTQR